MSTRFRSACDRCHDAKVRCSGDMPCHGCIASKNLCFYSVSNVLGRPRGTKNKTSRRRLTSNATSEAKMSASAQDQPTSPKPTTRRRKIKNDSSPPPPGEMSNSIPENESIDVQAILDPMIDTPTDSTWFFPGDNLHSLGQFESLGGSDFMFDSFTPAESNTPILGRITPPVPTPLGRTLDLSMPDFIEEPNTFSWDNTAYSMESTAVRKTVSLYLNMTMS